MSATGLKLANAPIVEAVLDVDCDMPPAFDLAALEASAREALRDRYPEFKTQLIRHHRLEAKADELRVKSVKQGLQAFQFLQVDKQQLVQFRTQGFSFNRLAPYTTLDDYLLEIQRTWQLFVSLAKPVQIRVVRLRYINRILLPLTGGRVELEDYVKVSPRLPEDSLTLASFLNQYSAVEAGSGHEISVVVTAQPIENDRVPIIFDNCVASAGVGSPDDSAWFLSKIESLRGLKNRIFRNTLTDKCLNLYR